jgi:hypothetical protein
MRERRRFVERRVQISAAMSHGWLAFESEDGERRRLAPIPERDHGWDAASEDELRGWCESAHAAPPVRRLIE